MFASMIKSSLKCTCIFAVDVQSSGHELNKSTNKGAQLLDSIYYMILKLFLNHSFGVKMLIFAIYTQHCMDVITKCYYIYKPLVVYQF